MELPLLLGGSSEAGWAGWLVGSTARRDTAAQRGGRALPALYGVWLPFPEAREHPLTAAA